MNNRPVRLLRVTTVPISLKILLRGQLAWMRAQGFEVLAVSADGPEVSDLQSEGIAHKVVRMHRAITPLADLIAVIRMYRVIREFRPDIIHTHTPKAGLVGLLAARLAGVPVRFHTVAGLPLMGLSGWRRQLLVRTERFTYRCATRVFVNSFSLREYIDREITRGKFDLTVLGNGSSNGIDTEYFSRHTEVLSAAQDIRRSLSIPEAAPVFCFIGRVVRDKGIGELINAFDQVRDRRPDVQLLLVGPLEPERDPLTPSDAARIAAG
ncbi:MAG: glycosyltransferase, partial [Bacteroidota bacterium]